MQFSTTSLLMSTTFRTAQKYKATIIVLFPKFGPLHSANKWQEI